VKLAAIAATAWATIFSVAVLAQPAEVTLRIQREPGEALRYGASVSGSGTITMLGEERAVDIRGRFTRVERTVSQVEPGVWEVETTIEQPSLTFRAGGKEQTMTMPVPALTEVVTDRGRVLEVRGWDAAVANPGAPGMSDVARPLFGLIQDEGLPEGPLKVGDTWTATATLKTAGEPDVRVKQQFELVGWEDVARKSCAKVRMTATIPVHRTLPPNALGMQVRLEGSQRIENTSFLAYQEGKLMRQQTVINLDVRTATLLDASAPERTLPGAISLRVVVALELQR